MIFINKTTKLKTQNANLYAPCKYIDFHFNTGLDFENKYQNHRYL